MASIISKTEARALGERWIAAAGVGFSGWRPGMMDNHGRRVFSADTFSVWWSQYNDDLHPWPDLRDPATKGAALAVVRERWGEEFQFVWLEWYPPLRMFGVRGWREGAVSALICSGATEAEALVAALEDAPR